MFSNAPIGRNLEAACRAFAFRLTAVVYCGNCGGRIGCRVAEKDASRAHFCSPGCLAAARDEAEYEAGK